uniref:Uncharacterized protein n=1 Tax=Chlorella vulgaris TaxID=3077 RepID=V9H0Y8_CHLVU|nr:hypothetical protein ChvulCp110 [Chlorella vulgaris]pir/T07297/ triose phosphate/3-phosphoglycerate/phosphate translocator homolog - Chlorella vulgaris chloroplast [Chlorella vulgaris]BAA57945.1 unnamed protein product [Chlorella vulgaris]
MFKFKNPAISFFCAKSFTSPFFFFTYLIVSKSSGIITNFFNYFDFFAN